MNASKAQRQKKGRHQKVPRSRTPESPLQSSRQQVQQAVWRVFACPQEAAPRCRRYRQNGERRA